ncbi:TlpA disulfide reductase family protein [Ferdinandcohnia quinoae]|uniref:TlpA family protein disulfide reductase n=1 Tax=Fredinandcohnia quinoae TaxID=2918902 RepID=A0AAW5E347_9BACI|nr:TlpA disulfide reductase family protein [Fredinandcohnia sp. SECRCQ15]MCH1625655.1 TlpA family protein disulfide reductase [Fredinandcohnia sp. SECRCQ15]
MKKIIAILVLVGLLGYAFWQYSIDQKREVVGIEIGNTAPDFELPLIDKDGEMISLSSLKGKKVVVNFWASWCKPCREEMPEIQKYYETRNDDVEVLAINMTASEVKVENAKNFIDGKGYTFPILLDEKNRASSDYEVLGLPVTFFINSDGTLNDFIRGQMDLKMMKQYINKLD